MKRKGDDVKIKEPGIYLDVPAVDYFGDCCPAPSFTQSLAKLMLERSPRHVWTEHPRLNPVYVHDDGDYRKDQAIGNAAHALLLGRGKELAIINADDFRTKVAQQAKEAARALGQTPILAKHYDTATEMVVAAVKQLDDVGIQITAELGDSEVVAVAEEGGFWLRSMIDLLSHSRTLVLDYKTSAMCCSPYALPQKLNSDGFDVQAAFHERILDALDPATAGRRGHLFLCQENDPPYALTVAQLSEAVLTIGRKKVDYAVGMWKRCMAADQWPLYPSRIVVPEMPQWAESRWLDREMQEQTVGENVNLLAAG